MKKYMIYTVLAGFLLTACTREEVMPDPLESLNLAATFQNSTHKIALYTPNGRFQTGYNPVTLKITDQGGNTVENAAISWSPLMHMESMTHGCPASAVSPAQNGVYRGYLVFQMASNTLEYWELTLNYTVSGREYTLTEKIPVSESEKRVVQSFQGTDGNRYLVALTEPAAPKVGVNIVKALIYRMEGMMKFTPVKGYRLKTDPRMPGMGNHSSPNNTDLTDNATEFYEGRLSLTMTGYWKINLQLADPEGRILKGEAVSESREASSIFFEIEF
ncbi:hypothetical protein [Leadbetterella sp. DM7]|uniref:hypothetical protein n=1 Tax=Leadbetterella sp. DM7 TaxID=3235085 RepID=UPI00349EED82